MRTFAAVYKPPQDTKWIPSLTLFTSLPPAWGTGFATIYAMREAIPRSMKTCMMNWTGTNDYRFRKDKSVEWTFFELGVLKGCKPMLSRDGAGTQFINSCRSVLTHHFLVPYHQHSAMSAICDTCSILLSRSCVESLQKSTADHRVICCFWLWPVANETSDANWFMEFCLSTSWYILTQPDFIGFSFLADRQRQRMTTTVSSVVWSA